MATKLKRGDKVQVIAGKYKGKEGKVLLIDRKKNKIIVEGVAMVTKHQKPNAANKQGGLVQKEAAFAISNVMYLHNGKPTRLGYKVEVSVKDGKREVTKTRIAKTTGEVIN